MARAIELKIPMRTPMAILKGSVISKMLGAFLMVMVKLGMGAAISIRYAVGPSVFKNSTACPVVLQP